MNIESFVKTLAELSPVDNLRRNMYYGDTMGAKDRCDNLLYYLKIMQRHNPSRLFIGEAPGRLGCYLTGVPFTDEYTMVHNPFFINRTCLVQELMSLGQGVKPQSESTARVVWERLDKIPKDCLPLMWNIYPFHPSTVESTYFSSDDRPNRKPTRTECEFGKRVLSILLDCFNINEIYAIGRIPKIVLKNEYSGIKYIRHPSRGGANEFRKRFNEIYKIEDF